jgi:hypothetical protein
MFCSRSTGSQVLLLLSITNVIFPSHHTFADVSQLVSVLRLSQTGKVLLVKTDLFSFPTLLRHQIFNTGFLLKLPIAGAHIPYL